MHFNQLNSTNEFALALKKESFFKEGLVITTNYQTKGKGQNDNSWESDSGKNLLMSVVINLNISVEKNFDLNKLTSLAVYDVLSLLGVSSRIKWPNDIIVDNKKIAGILIHNIISNKMITSSIIGIGLNVNQEEFKKYIIPATSLLLQLGKQYDINYIRLTLLSCLYKRIDNYRKQIVIDRDYNDFLYEKNKKCSFLRNNQIQNGIIKSVDEHGCLIIQIGNKLCAFNENEIKCIFNI